MTSDYRGVWIVSILIVAFACDYVSCAMCPAVDICVEKLAENMKSTGHDQGEFCKVIKQVISCLTKSECIGETQSHKDSELKHFQKDSDTASCGAGEKLGPGISLLFIIYTVWKILYQK